MSDLYFGYSESIITPPTTMGLHGYQIRNEHGFDNSGVRDELYARALCLKSDDMKLILLTLDVCMINESIGNTIRKRVAEKLDIPVENIMLNASHTHSGPQTFIRNPDSYPEIAVEIDSYIKKLINTVVSLSSQASNMDFKGKIYTATFSARLGYNRRFVTKDENNHNKVEMLFSLWKNPEHDTGGVVDTDIPVLLIERIDEERYDSYLGQSGTDRIVLFNVAAHPVVMGQTNRYVSADYPGAARTCIENALGDGTKAMFLLGACGNVNAMLACQNNLNAVSILGNAIGYGICTALSCRRKVEFTGLKVIAEDIKLKEGRELSRIVTQVFKIGNAAIAAVSCECFTELGICIRSESDFDQTLVATNSNGGNGYIPTKESWEIEGGYELPIAKKFGFDEDLLDRIADTVVKNLRQLKDN